MGNQMKMNPRAWGQSGPKHGEDMEEKPSNSTILHAQFNPFEPKDAENMEEKPRQSGPKDAENMQENDEQFGDKNAQDMEEKDEQKEPKSGLLGELKGTISTQSKKFLKK